MKKILLSIFMLCCISANMSAQEVYNAIREKTISTLQDPNTIPMLKMFNQFKLDALDYMAIKMKEVMPDSTASYLDKQAYAMNNFITLYLRTIINCQNQPSIYQIDIIKLFMDASYSNPLFNDTDKELVLSYFSDGSSMTRFSLDTDWQRAYIAASQEIQKKVK